MYKAVLFDLDGTLTESGEGIVKSVQYALERLGFRDINRKDLLCFVGPPLVRSFMKFYKFSREQAEEGVRLYRERFGKVGIYENKLYPGIPEMLRKLKASGYRIAVASGKPEEYVLKILDYFEIASFFDVVTGSLMDGRRLSKKEVIEECLSRLGMSDDRKHVLMVGDREDDVFGAREAGVDCAAVLYGYGSEQELKAANPAYIVETVDKLTEMLVNGPEAPERPSAEESGPSFAGDAKMPYRDSEAPTGTDETADTDEAAGTGETAGTGGGPAGKMGSCGAQDPAQTAEMLNEKRQEDASQADYGDLPIEDRLRRQLDFSLEIDKEKNIFRQTHLSGKGRNENDAEHAWHMAIMAYLFREYANEKVDITRVMLMCLIHDIVEIDAGDTYAYDEAGIATQKQREDAAKERIFSILPDDQRSELIDLFDEFEACETPEAKFAHAMDNLQPLMLNNSNHGGDWREHKVRSGQIYRRQEKTRLGSARLYEVIDSLIQKNIREGNILP